MVFCTAGNVYKAGGVLSVPPYDGRPNQQTAQHVYNNQPFDYLIFFDYQMVIIGDIIYNARCKI
jgi:hypothetical protein